MQTRARWSLTSLTRPGRLGLSPIVSGCRLQQCHFTHLPFELSRTHLRRHGDAWKGYRYVSGGSPGLDSTTIFALSSAPGQSAIAVIRVSGALCLQIFRALCPGKPDPIPRRATVRTLYSPGLAATDSSILDRSALVLFFSAPQTVTGEDVLELHVHGGPAIIQAVLQAIPRCIASSPTEAPSPSITYAEPGEFTRRAFLNGKVDLTQVEALGHLLSAATEQQRRLSIHGSAGQLAKRYELWRSQLLNARGELEALIDFSEDQHFDESTSELVTSVADQVKSLIAPLQAHVSNAMRGELLRSGIQLSLLGAPNAGKSSLLNCIVGREAAIVSQEAGTTRDVVEVGIDIGGYFCRLGDTAGLRTEISKSSSSSIGAVEQEGMRRAKDRAVQSDVVVVVFDFEPTGDGLRLRLDPEVCHTAASLMQEKHNVLAIINKIDLLHEPQTLNDAIVTIEQSIPGLDRSRIFPVTCTSKQHEAINSVQAFLTGLTRYFDAITSATSPTTDSSDSQTDPSIWQESLGATVRHRLLLEQTIRALGAFLVLAQPDVSSSDQCEIDSDDVDIVLAAEHLRDAAACLAKITGRGDAGDVEEVLGVVFEKFCVGK